MSQVRHFKQRGDKMKNVIYYFTGTGNSLRAAQVIAEYLGDTEIISMRCDPNDVPALDAERIGFAFPVYHWTMPEHAIHFVEQVKLNPNAYIFAVSLPGVINGGSQDKLAELLQKKQGALAYGKTVYSVANYVAIYPPFPNPAKRVPKTEAQLAVIAQDIAAKTQNKHPKANALTRWLAPRMMQKFIEHCPSNDKYFSVWDDCISCGLCAKVCPSHNISFENGKPTFLHQCSQCMACIAFCPKQAINFPKYTRERKKYHNPNITVAEIIADKKFYPAHP